MTAVIDLISAAIAYELDADPTTNFGYDFTTIESGGDWDLELEDAGPPENPNVLQVDLVAVSDKLTIASTKAADGTKDVRHECAFQVVVRRRLTEREEDSGRVLFSVVQGLTELVEKIAMFFLTYELTTLTNATWIASEVESIRYPATMRENSQFTGIARITYELIERD